jgi:hypothetical protein
MQTNRDPMHAAGGDFITGQMQREQATSNQTLTARQRSKRVTLTMKDDYALVQWMHNREPQYGETPQDIFVQASAALNIPGLNSDHIRTRLIALADTLPKAKCAPLSLEQRIDRLERLGVIIARLRTNGDSGTVAELAFLADFENAVAQAS